MSRRLKVLLPVFLAAAVVAGLVGYSVARQQAQIASESLLEAAENGHAGRVAFLLSLGQDPNERDGVGWTPLHWSAYRGDVRVVRSLLEHSADVNASAKDVDAWAIAVSSTVRPEFYRAPLKTPLFAAAAGGSADVAELLLDHGADTAALDPWGGTPLHRAAWEGERGVAEALLEHGADADARSDGGRTPLHWAVRGHGGFHWTMPFKSDTNRDRHVNSAAVVQLLLGAGAFVDARDDKGWTPLHWAAAYGHVQLARMLVSAGADVNTKVKDQQVILRQRPLRYGGPGQTPLHLAVGDGDSPPLVAYFLAHGADPSIKDDQGRTALDVAVKCGCKESERLLRKHGDALKRETAR